MRDLHSSIKRVKSIGAVAAAADVVGAIIDRQGFESLEYELDIGIGGITFDGTNKIEFFLEHGDDPTLSDASLVVLADLVGHPGPITSGIVKSLIVAHAASTPYRFGYRGNKRYSRMTANFSGTHGSPTPMAVTALLSDPALAPVPNQI